MSFCLESTQPDKFVSFWFSIFCSRFSDEQKVAGVFLEQTISLFLGHTQKPKAKSKRQKEKQHVVCSLWPPFSKENFRTKYKGKRRAEGHFNLPHLKFGRLPVGLVVRLVDCLTAFCRHHKSNITPAINRLAPTFLASVTLVH